MGVSHTPQPVTGLDDRGPGTGAFLAPTCFLLFNTFSSLPAPRFRASCFRGHRPQQKSLLSSTVSTVLLCNSSPAPLQRRPRPSNHQTTIISIALWEYPTSLQLTLQANSAELSSIYCSHLPALEIPPQASINSSSFERIPLSSRPLPRPNQVSLIEDGFLHFQMVRQHASRTPLLGLHNLPAQAPSPIYPPLPQARRGHAARRESPAMRGAPTRRLLRVRTTAAIMAHGARRISRPRA